jgi:hypothetical protein
VIEFKTVLTDFADTMEALREFIAGLGPVLLERRKIAMESFAPLMQRFSSALLLTGDVAYMETIPEEHRAQWNDIIAQVTKLAEKNQPEIRIQFQESLKKIVPVKFTNGKVEVDWDVPEAAEVLPAKRELDSLKNVLRLLHESALMALASRSEWLVAQLLHLYFERFPNAAGGAEPFFSLDTLSALQSIDEARQVLIEHRVEALMRESFPEWMKFFRDRTKLGMGYMSDEVERIEEVFKRRNLVVHNGGRANRRYFKEVREPLRQGVKIGEVVDVGPSYLNSSINLLEHQLVLLTVELWKNLAPNDTDRGGLLASLAVRCLELQRWTMARGFSFFGMNDKGLPEALRLSNQINYWQSFKWAGEYESVREEIEKADFSAKSPLYRLAHAAIKSDFETCFKLLSGVLERKELSKVDLQSWPIFQELRQQAEYSVYTLPEIVSKTVEANVADQNNAGSLGSVN